MIRLPIGRQALPDQIAHQHHQAAAPFDREICPPNGSPLQGHRASQSIEPGRSALDGPRAVSTEPPLQRFQAYALSRIEVRALCRQQDERDVGRDVEVCPRDASPPDRRAARRARPARSAWRFRPDGGSSPWYCSVAGRAPRPCRPSGRSRRRCRPRRFAGLSGALGARAPLGPAPVILFFWPMRASSANQTYYVVFWVIRPVFARDFLQARGETFLKSSIAPAACA